MSYKPHQCQQDMVITRRIDQRRLLTPSDVLLVSASHHDVLSQAATALVETLFILEQE
jgi:hypothetical protein